MTDSSMEKAFRFLIMEIRIRGPMSKTSLKDKANTNGKILPFIKESLSQGLNMGPDCSFTPTVKPSKNTTTTIRKST